MYLFILIKTHKRLFLKFSITDILLFDEQKQYFIHIQSLSTYSIILDSIFILIFLNIDSKTISSMSYDNKKYKSSFHVYLLNDFIPVIPNLAWLLQEDMFPEHIAEIQNHRLSPQKETAIYPCPIQAHIVHLEYQIYLPVFLLEEQGLFF